MVKTAKSKDTVPALNGGQRAKGSASSKSRPKPKPTPPATLAQETQHAIDDEIRELLEAFNPASSKSKAAPKPPAKQPDPNLRHSQAPPKLPNVAGSSKAPFQKPPTAGGGALRPPPSQRTAQQASSRPPSKRTTRNGGTSVEDVDEDDDDPKTMEDYQADINNLCGLDGEEEEGGTQDSADGVFPEPEGEPGRSPTARRPGYNLQVSLGLGTKVDIEDTEFYRKLLGTTRFGLTHYKFNPNITQTKQDKRKEFAMYALLTKEYPEFINTRRFPRLWCVRALTVYCFKNKRGYVRWKKPALAARKLAAATGAGSQAAIPPATPAMSAARVPPVISAPAKTTAGPPRKEKEIERQSSPGMPLLDEPVDDDALSYVDNQGESSTASDIQEVLRTKAPKAKKPIAEESGEDDEGKQYEGEERLGGEGEEDTDEESVGDLFAEAPDIFAKMKKLSQLMEKNPSLARQLSRAPSLAPRKVIGGKRSPAESGMEDLFPSPKKSKTVAMRNGKGSNGNGNEAEAGSVPRRRPKSHISTRIDDTDDE